MQSASCMLWVTVSVVSLAVMAATCTVSQMPTKDSFNINKYTGKWYEIQYLPYYWENIDEIYSDYSETYEVNEIMTEVEFDATGRPANADICTTEDMSYQISQHDAAKWTITKQINATTDVLVDYWILETDYDNYAYVYGCDVVKPDGTCEKVHAWVWGRQTNLSSEHLQLLENYFENSCVESSDFISSRQEKDCSSTSGGSPIMKRIVEIYMTIVTLIFGQLLLVY